MMAASVFSRFAGPRARYRARDVGGDLRGVSLCSVSSAAGAEIVPRGYALFLRETELSRGRQARCC